MPKLIKESKLLPLSSKDIRRVFFENEKSIASWARENNFDPWQVRAVISRNPEVVYQEIREALAAYVGCDVSQIGREPSREPVEVVAA